MTWAAQAGSVIGGAGLALLYVAPGRRLRIAGLAAWALGLAGLAAYLAPSMSAAKLAAAAVAGLVVAAAGAWALLRWPYLLAFATLACLPVRIPVTLGDEDANLLLPLYVVVGALALALGWELAVRRDAPHARARSGCAPPRRLCRLDRPHPPLECGRARGSDLRRRVRVAVRPALDRLRATAVARPLADVAVGRPRRHGARVRVDRPLSVGDA